MSQEIVREVSEFSTVKSEEKQNPGAKRRLIETEKNDQMHTKIIKNSEIDHAPEQVPSYDAPSATPCAAENRKSFVDASTNTESSPPITITTFQISVDEPNGIDIYPVKDKPNTYSISLRILKNLKDPFSNHEQIIKSGVELFENLGKVNSKGVTLSLEELARNQGADFFTQQLFKIASEGKVNLFENFLKFRTDEEALDI